MVLGLGLFAEGFGWDRSKCWGYNTSVRVTDRTDGVEMLKLRI